MSAPPAELPTPHGPQPGAQLPSDVNTGAQPPPAANSTGAQAPSPVLVTAGGGCGPSESFDPGEFFSALLKQSYIDQQYVPREILSPVDFEDRIALQELLSEKCNRKVEILAPQRGEKRSLIDLAAQNAKQSGNRGVHGGVGRRQDEQIRIP